MKNISISDIRNLNPCYDPGKHLPEDWSGPIDEFLCYEHIPASDRLWVVLHPQFLSEKVLREYGLACSRMVEHLSNDTRVSDCNTVYESFLDGIATEQECVFARNAAASYAASYATVTAYAAYDAACNEMREQQCQLLLYILEAFGNE